MSVSRYNIDQAGQIVPNDQGEWMLFKDHLDRTQNIRFDRHEFANQVMIESFKTLKLKKAIQAHREHKTNLNDCIGRDETLYRVLESIEALEEQK